MINKNINKSINSYLNSDYTKFKNYERIHFIINEISKKISKDKNYSFLDIGCSKGEFIFLLKEKFSNINFTGIEYSSDLIKLAKDEVFLNDVNFIKGDARNFNLNQKFDFVLMSGVLSIFDDIKTPINRMFKHLNSDGVGYIFGAFNKDDIDVLVRYKNNFVKSEDWESGWNLFSLNTVKKVLKNESKKIEILNFKIQNKLFKKSDPVSSYTLDIKSSKEKVILTGGGIVRDFYLIKFVKK
jgi:ubiquinone/menaquinone biosynthesis C-methylase UbiE